MDLGVTHWLVAITLGFLCVFIAWRIHKVIKNNPEVMSRENLGKSFTSMAILALILIGFVFMLVTLLRTT